MSSSYSGLCRNVFFKYYFRMTDSSLTKIKGGDTSSDRPGMLVTFKGAGADMHAIVVIRTSGDLLYYLYSLKLVLLW